MIAFAFVETLCIDRVLPLILLYIGPDVFLPLTSALAALAGFLLMFWQRVVGFVSRMLGRTPRVTSTPERPATDKPADPLG